MTVKGGKRAWSPNRCIPSNIYFVVISNANRSFSHMAAHGIQARTHTASGRESMHIVMASEPIHGLYLGFVNSVREGCI